MTFYDPGNPVAREAGRLGREGAGQLSIEFDERHVASVKELQAGVRGVRAGEVDAYFEGSDAMVISQAQLIIDTAGPRGYRQCSLTEARSSKGAFQLWRELL